MAGAADFPAAVGEAAEEGAGKMKKKSLLLAIDIGNTAVSLGIMSGTFLTDNHHLDTYAIRGRISKELKALVKSVKRQYPEIDQVIICSVVPALTKLTSSLIKKYFGVKPRIVGQDLIVPIKNNYDHPAQVGQDRLVGTYAAKILYGYPLIIIDFGTAITFDVISAKGFYEGGMIVPGIRLSAESLFRKTALLPKIETIKTPRTLIGKNTKESILSGLFFGYGAMSCGLIDMISKRIKGKPKVIVTGGYTHLMKKFILPKINKIDRDLVFKGLALLSRSNSSRR